MVFEFKLPDLGEGMEEATIIKWLVRPGDIIKKDQKIAEVETDKAVVEIPSPVEGKVIELRFKEGETARVGSVLLTIGPATAKVDVVSNIGAGEVPARGAEAPRDVLATPRVRALARELGVDIKMVKGTGKHGEISEDDVRAAAAKKRPVLRELDRSEDMRVVEKVHEHPPMVQAVPKARDLAKKMGIDLSKVAGTGPGGVILERDVQSAAERLESIVEVGKLKKDKEAEPISEKIAHPLKGELAKYIEVRVPIKGVRKSIISRLGKSNCIAVQATAIEDADVTQLVELREREKANAAKDGIHLTYLPFVIKAAVIALKRHPWLNSTVDEHTNEFVIKKYYNIGIAVDTEDGLIVPVVKDVDLKSIIDIAREIMVLSDKARKRELSLDEVSGGTFTITNWGSIGATYGVPVLNYPECAILGIGKIQKKPVVMGNSIVIRDVMPLSLTFDHRITDGAEAARFLLEVKRHLEDPGKLLVDIV
ncbi:MAG: 2-oxo acid dehydrogenase subunit E2 [Candidatus Micrarchaeota archaeon]|nr:2-oxo acid dehydrogenase subunit E2 [Candidatus Micrarchaeota archaeon]